MKKVLFSAALLMGFAAVSFAGSPKDGKTAADNSGETKTAELYWYKVSYAGNSAGYIPANAPVQAHDVQENVEADCDPGSTRDCFRGFEEPLSGMSLSAGDGQIKTDEQP